LGNPAVPPETETEWQILQPGKVGFEERGDAVDVGDASESVTRRYEFYEYTGGTGADGEATNEDPRPYDADPHPNGYDQLLFPDGVVGRFIGRQNVAANLDIPEPGTVTLAVAGAIGLLGYGWRQPRWHGAIKLG